ncbi:Retrovirus-related Pol polyprotein from transposon TNT 1-94 [Nymphaea thermarum]|nr:Retrovirus-related Pol polyprotein from transposon TNT 1-94 [Nymphaea thermarum]
MAASSSSTVNSDHTEIRTYRTENVPVQVTTMRLTKENYFKWSVAITMGIAGRGRIAYVNESKGEPPAKSMAWDTWFLEDNQVKTWIVNSVSLDIQSLILRKKTARDMWLILEQMHSQKKRKVRVYQLMKELYTLRQGDLSVADFYPTLKSKWEDLDYHSDDTCSCPQDQMHYMAKELDNRIFLFLAGLNDEFKYIRSQILNFEESFSIEDVYSRVEAEEQRQPVINGRKGDHMSHNERSAFVSRASMGIGRSPRKCTHCKKLGHTMEFCWDLHLEKKNSRGRSSGGKKPISNALNPNDSKVSISADQIRELRAYLSQIDVDQADTSDEVKVNQALAVSGEKGTSCMGEWNVDSGATHHMTGNPKLFHDYKLSSGNERVSLADSSFTSVAGKGSLSLLNNFLVHGALHVPHLPLNFLSISKITKDEGTEL